MTPRSACRRSLRRTWPRCTRSATSSRRSSPAPGRRPDMGWAEIAATSLENEHVLLRPVRPEDRESLRAIAMDPEIWRYFVLRIETDADFEELFDAALAATSA